MLIYIELSIHLNLNENVISIKMDFTQATRYILPLFKVFAIIPFDISGPPGQRRIQKNRKWFIFGNIFKALAICFLLNQLVAYFAMVSALWNLVHFVAFLVFTIGFLFLTISSLRHHNQHIQFYQEFLQITDCHPNCCKYFSIIFYFFIFNAIFFILNVSIEFFFYLIEDNLIDIWYELVMLIIELNQNLFIAQYNLILISMICIFKALNENLLKFQLDINSYHNLFNLFNKINSIEGLNLLLEIFSLYFWFLAAAFYLLLDIIHCNDNYLFIISIFFFVNIFNYLVQNVFVMCLLIEQLKREVR